MRTWGSKKRGLKQETYFYLKICSLESLDSTNQKIDSKESFWTKSQKSTIILDISIERKALVGWRILSQHNAHSPIYLPLQKILLVGTMEEKHVCKTPSRVMLYKFSANTISLDFPHKPYQNFGNQICTLRN